MKARVTEYNGSDEEGGENEDENDDEDSANDDEFDSDLGQNIDIECDM